MRAHQTLRSRWLFALGVLLASVLASSVTVAVAQSPHFPDVDGGFEAEIDAIFEAGCASGFNDGDFRPRDGTTRGQFAFWMNNCGGRVGFNTTADNDFDAFETSELAPVVMEAGAIPGGTGHISLQANVNVYDPDGLNCPCRVQFGIFDVGANTFVSTLPSLELASPTENSGLYASGSVGAIAVVQGGDQPKYEIQVTMQDANNNNSVAVADLTAVYIPFDAFGNAPAVP